jgi:hypothetical protein
VTAAMSLDQRASRRLHHLLRHAVTRTTWTRIVTSYVAAQRVPPPHVLSSCQGYTFDTGRCPSVFCTRYAAGMRTCCDGVAPVPATRAEYLHTRSGSC